MKSVAPLLTSFLGFAIIACQPTGKEPDGGSIDSGSTMDAGSDLDAGSSADGGMDAGPGDAGTGDGGFGYQVITGHCDLVWQRVGDAVHVEEGRLLAAIVDIDGDARRDLIISEDDVNARTTALRLVSGRTGATIRRISFNSLVQAVVALGEASAGEPVLAVELRDCTNGGGPDAGTSSGDCVPTVQAVSAQTGAQLWVHTAPSSEMSASLARSSDFDGDGQPDLLRAHDRLLEVRSGATGALLASVTSPPNGSTSYGLQLSETPDLDGDGKPDWLMGDEVNDPTGTAGPGALYAVASRACMNCQPIVQWSVGGSAGSMLGGSPVPLADLNADGIVDVAVGAKQFVVAGLATGKVVVLNGSNGHELWEAVGINDQEGYGSRIVSLDDLDADGVSDLLIGAPVLQFPPLLGVPSRLEIRSGKSGGLLVNVTDEVNFGDFRIADSLGTSLAAVGDVAGDALPEFAASAVAFSEHRGAVVMLSCRP